MRRRRDGKLFRVLFGTLVVVGLVLISANTAAACEVGCTPGYWQNHLSAWPTSYVSPFTWMPISIAPGDLVSKHFPAAFGAPASLTLLQALHGGGGLGPLGAELILLRAGVAALLNAIRIGIPGGFVDVGFLVTNATYGVNPALASQNRDVMLARAAFWDGENNSGPCPF